MPKPAKFRNHYRGGYYYAIPKDRDSWLDGDIEVVYLGLNDGWSVLRIREMGHYPINAFSHWYGPIPRPELPSEVEGMLNAD
jgi:hypothetical protein